MALAQNTCDGASDYIAVSAGIVEKTSNVEYWSEMKAIGKYLRTVWLTYCMTEKMRQKDWLGESERKEERYRKSKMN